jgi:hypothetical protein
LPLNCKSAKIVKEPLYKTLIEQRKAFQMQQFEAKFFEMLRYHRENVQQMEHEVPSKIDKIATGSRVFIQMKIQFEEIYDYIISVSPEYLTDTTKYKDLEKHNINISYLILFIGVGIGTLSTVKSILKKHYPENFVDVIINKLREKRSLRDDTLYFGGHQVRLGQGAIQHFA